MSAREEATIVPTAVGDLHGLVRRPSATGPFPGVVLVDGSGPGTVDGWGGWPEWVADCGAVVLRHDKPGCGGSPGDWRDQSFEDRADESIAAARVLRSLPGTDDQAVGLLGISQGGWVALLAAARDPRAVDFAVSISGPGVTPERQERVRIERALRREGFVGRELEDALEWVDERTRRQLAREAPESILADQRLLAARPWYEVVTFGAYGEPGVLAFATRIFGFDPVPVVADVRCPLLLLFGGADDVVPVAESVAAFGSAVPTLGSGPSGLAVFPEGNHGLFVADPDPRTPRKEQLAPGVLPMLEAFLARRSDASRMSATPPGAAPDLSG